MSNKEGKNNQLPTTIAPEEQQELRDHLEMKRIESLHALAKKGQYTKAMINIHGPIWWNKILEMLESADRDDKRIAIQEINKLQIKSLPTELTGEGGGDIVFKIAPYLANNPTVKPDHPLEVEGELVDDDADTVAV